ncbi:hypothetical protein K504DRAFT_536787 [Pleomassaria siparia CBS 279.74]|uniref:Extracellular membrane protein CFEM domain-containing protein n=1 Tax=Pleomassaria siparia CBS 279.74 TaxID=1314801 RepID=A0A6G1JZA3_9PLEO|nr:hypothetical protein K504DRAFT_536787 [Pleomassaria siparia CBS 279.74]
MKFLTLLAVLVVPSLTSAAAIALGSSPDVCIPCAQSFDLCASEPNFGQAEVSKCLQSACNKSAHHCNKCEFCGTLNGDVETRDEVSVADKDHNADTSAFVCYFMAEQCSTDGKTVQVCHMTSSGYRWVFKKRCGGEGCCAIGNGKNPYCRC